MFPSAWRARRSRRRPRERRWRRCGAGSTGRAGWKPTKAGEKLIGELVDVDLRDSDYGDPYNILVVQVESGQEDGKQLEPGTEKAWHAFHTMASSLEHPLPGGVPYLIALPFAETTNHTS